MRPAELFLQALARVVDGRSEMVLVLPRQPSGERMRLFGKHGGPTCEVLCVNSENETVVAVNAREVADWLVDRGAVTVSAEGGEHTVRDDAGAVVLDLVVRQKG